MPSGGWLYCLSYSLVIFSSLLWYSLESHEPRKSLHVQRFLKCPCQCCSGKAPPFALLVRALNLDKLAIVQISRVSYMLLNVLLTLYVLCDSIIVHQLFFFNLHLDLAET